MKLKILLRIFIFFVFSLVLSYGTLFLARWFALMYGGIPFLGGGSKSFLDIALVYLFGATSYIGPSILAFSLYRYLRAQNIKRYIRIIIVLVIATVPFWMYQAYSVFNTIKSNIRGITYQNKLCKNRNGTNESITESSQEKQIFECKNGRMNGMYQSFYPHGILHVKTFYINGAQAGESISFNANGQIERYENYLKDLNKRSGLSISIGQDGIIESVINHKILSDQQSGKNYAWIYARPYFDNNRIHNIKSQSIICGRDDLKMEEFSCKNGVFDGVYREYRLGKSNEPKILFKESNFRNGSLEGTYKEFDTYEKYLKYKANYMNNELNGDYSEYDKNGDVVKTYTFRNGNPLLEELKNISYFQYIFN